MIPYYFDCLLKEQDRNELSIKITENGNIGKNQIAVCLYLIYSLRKSGKAFYTDNNRCDHF